MVSIQMMYYTRIVKMSSTVPNELCRGIAGEPVFPFDFLTSGVFGEGADGEEEKQKKEGEP